jgi:hypothetical protein
MFLMVKLLLVTVSNVTGEYVFENQPIFGEFPSEI